MNLYESEQFSNVTGPALRPGGLELTQVMLDLCALPPAAMVLDIGCGQGATLALLQKYGHCIYGVDISTTLLMKAMEAAPKAILARACATKTPFSEAYFDAAFAECVLSLMEPPAAMLQEAHRILKPNGLLGLTDIYIRELRDTGACDFENIKCCLKGAIQTQELKELIEHNNFEIIHLSDHTKRLKQLTAELIFAYGSLEAFWQFFLGEQEAKKIMPACSHKYGYYMLIARKKDLP